MPKRTANLMDRKRNYHRRVSFSRLETQRDMLLKRLERLHPSVKVNQGHRSAHALLKSRYVRVVGLAARLSVLQAAEFMISVLERMPPM